jgi:hypothetical protein
VDLHLGELEAVCRLRALGELPDLLKNLQKAFASWLSFHIPLNNISLSSRTLVMRHKEGAFFFPPLKVLKIELRPWVC